MQTISAGQVASEEGIVPAHAAAHRPSLAWRTAKVLGKVALGVCAATTLGLGGLISTESLGTVQGLDAFVTPVQRIAPAPPGMSWIHAPHSPMLEVGRTADGGIDTRQMLMAWRDAGMETRDVYAALKMVQQLRPVLMGRNDPVAAAEHRVQMNEVSKELEAAFPGVIENLIANSPPPAFDEYEAEIWSAVIDRLEGNIAHDLPQADHSPTLGANLAQLARWNAAHPDATLPVPSILARVFKSPADYDPDRFLDVLRRGGVTAMEASFIHRDLTVSTAPVFDLPRESVTERIKELEDLNKFGHGDLTEQDYANISRAAADPSFSIAPRTKDHPSHWQDLQAEIAHDAPASQAKVPAKVSMDQAPSALEQAVRTAGLRSFSPSLWQMRSPEAMMDTAQKLQQANAELAHATGWKGQVLGLDGRVELSMGPIVASEVAPSAAALVAVDGTGRLQMVSGWAELGHEWFHAFDHVAAREVLVNPSQRPLTENAQVLRSFHDTEIKQAARNLNESFNDGSPNWERQREEVDELTDKTYFTRGAEVGAFAFAAYLTKTGAKVLTHEAYADPGEAMEIHRTPSLDEQEHQAPFFKALFDATLPLNLAGHGPPKMKPINEWRSTRASVEALIPATRNPTIR